MKIFTDKIYYITLCNIALFWLLICSLTFILKVHVPLIKMLMVCSVPVLVSLLWVRYLASERIIRAYTIIILSLFLLPTIAYYSIFHPYGDTEWFYTKIIVETGHTHKLIEEYNDIVYGLTPIPQLEAATLSILCGLSTTLSFTLTYFIFYVLTIVFFLMILRNFTRSKLKTFAYGQGLFIALLSTYYFHRPFHDLMQISLGMYVLLLALWLTSLVSFKKDKRAFILAALSSILATAHILTVYILALLSCIFTLSRLIYQNWCRIKINHIFSITAIFFFSTYSYQITTALLQRFVTESYVRFSEVLKSFMERGISSSAVLSSAPSKGAISIPHSAVMEQSLHYLYHYHKLIIPFIYAYPICLNFILTLAVFLYFRNHKYMKAMILPLAISSGILLLVTGVYAYYGLENYVARYAYSYGSVIFILFFALLFYHLPKSIKVILSITGLLTFMLWITEPFFAPWFSLYNTYDTKQLNTFLARNMYDRLYMYIRERNYFDSPDKYLPLFDINIGQKYQMVYNCRFYAIVRIPCI